MSAAASEGPSAAAPAAPTSGNPGVAAGDVVEPQVTEPQVTEPQAAEPEAVEEPARAAGPPTDHDESVVEEAVVAASAAVTGAVHDIGGFIRTQRESAEVSLRQLAKRTGVSNPYLSQIERGLRKPSADVLAQIAKGLRVSAEVLYEQAGIVERRPASPVVEAVLSDVFITERQKQVLVEIYESFKREDPVAPAATPA